MGTVIDRHVPRIVQEGDILVGIHSSGPHSNGFSMLREVLPIDEIPLTPTRIYTDEILNNHHLINAVSHITGGGLIENIPRMLGGREHSLEVSIVGDLVYGNDWWNDLYLKCQNKMDMREFLTIFNGGYGMVLAVSPHNVDKLNIENTKVIGKVL